MEQFDEFRLFNFDPALVCDFRIFASRAGVNDIRDATYGIIGANSTGGNLDATNNNTEILGGFHREVQRFQANLI
jgi:hypothetical protein